jgi:FtsZ-interacting cell division protein ZipA
MVGVIIGVVLVLLVVVGIWASNKKEGKTGK